MTYKDFAAWLQGVIDSNPDGLSRDQLAIISDKISKLTYPKETPHFGIQPFEGPPKIRC